MADVTYSADAEAAHAFGFFLEHFDVFDLSASGPLVDETHELLDRVRLTFEHGLHRPVPPIRHPASDAVLLRRPPRRTPEEHALDVPVHDDAPANHAPYSLAVVEFRDILKRRRMARAYEPDPVPREALERIVATVRRAPSAGFSQGQRLVVVTDREQLDRIAALLGDSTWIGEAPVLIAVCIREDDYHDRYTEPDKLAITGGVEIDWVVPFWYLDAGAAAMLILLAAIDEGYAAGLFGIFRDALPGFRELLQLPSDIEVTCCITIGRAAKEPGREVQSSRMTQRRRTLDDLVRWQRWSG
jgi:FMN reductase [NAD(P)H]